ncbi:MAG: hypothetical protein AAFZ07_25680 [Actinomycetota bacterium]
MPRHRRFRLLEDDDLVTIAKAIEDATAGFDRSHSEQTTDDYRTRLRQLASEVAAERDTRRDVNRTADADIGRLLATFEAPLAPVTDVELARFLDRDEPGAAA